MNENRLIKYDPELNTIPLRKFTPAEMNLLFGIISEVQGKKDSVVTLTFEQLKDLSNYKPTANKRFIDDLYSTYSKLLSLRFGRMSKTGLTREMFVLFNKFKIIAENTKTPHVDLRVQEEAIPILNELSKWVRFNYSDFIKLNSSYSKTMFRLLKQYRTTGYVYYDKENFYELLDIPKSYIKNQANLDNRVINPILEELSPIFKGLNIYKRKSKHRGRAIIGFEFTFKPERKDVEDIKRNNEQMLKDRMFNLINNNSLSYKQKRKAAIKAFNDFSADDYQELEDKGELPIWAKIPEDKKLTKPLENNSTSDKTPKNKVTEEEKTRVFDLWTQIFGMNGFKYASKQLIDLINMYPTELISEQIQQYTAFAGDNFSVTMVIDLLKNSLHHAYTKELEERKSESIVEEQTELSEVEKLKQKIAELEAKVNSKPKEVRGLFDDADLKKSEKKITDNLDKMTGKNPQDFEQTDLF
ncbi:replication initiation protein (plasmid) [Ligilactobacillus salivarius]|uniref:replication initiation protein n=1 Tax=Ligilactobacillus salivarius TaxID=1624 RepID=UPI00263ABA46|nr:replication initiation protein [Ligilactobacillus salivarius]MDN4849170.1 replication initiation protein [Ligilactobacillus salivarius]